MGYWVYDSISTSDVDIISEDGKDCISDDDCVVFGKTGDCNCGCYNKNNLPLGTGGECFCQAPESCKCVDGKCEGIFIAELVTFKECVEAGNPILESYPRQCETSDGRIFIEEHCSKKDTQELLTLADAEQIAINSECGDRLKEPSICNEDTGTWWIDLDIEKESCNPACVINVMTKEASINWRCMGVIN
ncbi:MAG: hypothetical protein KAS91_00620 [Candidatus Pacebacteria bacterium]|nr:hypothetical protein [Candidatus Paceibacterota bacterium]